MKFRLTLYGKTYVDTEDGFQEVKTTHYFDCDCLVQLLDLLTDMVKTSTSELDFSVGREDE